MEQQVFADGVGTITIIGQTVRFDLVVLSPTEKNATGQPEPVFLQRVVMGTDSFLSSLQRWQSAAEALGRLSTAPAPTSTETQASAPQPASTPYVNEPPAETPTVRRPFP
ncbi:MAG: hypothetical protein KGR48_11610 [Alphaproteobacteria bacterium]|nr:hypothetical protein [Alphaproteobacteria bacterium]MBU6471656.1 hypothetical protein [Alphaproteobacteria bacterium]MDE2012642.1 hypothetical protein [Alphaproteobacteria bacterium]MDE2072123.1 hypothetical protein [Alphaproteobacteria bacterium]